MAPEGVVGVEAGVEPAGVVGVEGLGEVPVREEGAWWNRGEERGFIDDM